MLQHVRGVEKQQLGRNVTALQAQSLQPSFAKCLAVVELGTQDWMERLPASSNLNLQLSQAAFAGSGNFCTVSKTDTPPSVF